MAARAGTTSSLSLARLAGPSASAGGGTARTGHRASGIGHAVAAHLAGDEPAWHATAAETQDQQVSGAAGHAGQDPASLAARYDRPDRWGRRGPLPRGLGAQRRIEQA